MMFPLSDREAAILLGATLMHWGVPFHRVNKRELSDDQQATVDATSTRLVARREEYRGHPAQQVQAIALSDNEITLLTDVLEDCLAECGNDATELGLHLKASTRQEVATLVNRLRHCHAPSA
jgi:hypothetical protein